MHSIGISSLVLCSLLGPALERPLKLEPVRDAQFQFGGVMRNRLSANLEHWLLEAPKANPGLLEMFTLRDRNPRPNLVPWAGEFVGKYLLSAIGALPSQPDPADARLRELIEQTVKTLLERQAEDGYLGPFPRKERLLGQWDLWGHYHVMLALLAWQERTGDEASLAACQKAADLVCRVYLDGGRRVLDAGSAEMNMAILHGLARLHLETGNARYLQMVRQIEQDWQKAGDYFRAGLAGVEFYRTPRPRWESLHDLQGLVDLGRITGDQRYQQSFLRHWNSIRRCDRRNSGAFSSGEQATGSPFEPTAIETCCSIAWLALSVDALRLTGDSRVADEIERTTYNAVLGAQHPSGRWWTYSTPMDGVREASAHAIVFQARAGTPELNCCSVNGPRGLGMLSQWAVMQSPDALWLNYLGPMHAEVVLGDEHLFVLDVLGTYPAGEEVKVRIGQVPTKSAAIHLRIPEWSTNTSVRINEKDVGGVVPGQYLEIEREWKAGDTISLRLDMGLRTESGDREQRGKVSILRGPVLLAYDQSDNSFDADRISPITAAALRQATIDALAQTESSPAAIDRPMIRVRLNLAGGQSLILRDFASAGAMGTNYRSWLPATGFPPPAPVPLDPPDGARLPKSKARFTWRRMEKSPDLKQVELTILDRAFSANAARSLEPVQTVQVAAGTRQAIVDLSKLDPGHQYSWSLRALGPAGATRSLGPDKEFTIDLALPALSEAHLLGAMTGPDGILIADDLAGTPAPSFGKMFSPGAGVRAANGLTGRPATAIATDGRSKVVYSLERFPGEDYTAALWVRLTEQPEHLAQVLSAWCRPLDDPLRIAIEKGHLFARVEAGAGSSTPGVPIPVGQWHHVAVVKEESRLTLYLDGKERGQASVPAELATEAKDFALGGNPHYSGDEHLAARFAGLRFYARSLSGEEVARLAANPPRSGSR